MRAINILSLSDELKEKLKSFDINNVEDLVLKKRSELKELGFKNDELKNIIISLQLLGLDLNKRK